MNRKRWFGAVCFLAAVPLAWSATREVQLADPGAPAELVFRVAYVTLEVVGTSGNSVRIVRGDPEDDGAAAIRLPVAVQGNRVEIVDLHNTTLLEVRIEVPRRSDLRIETSNGGPVRVVNVDGAVEVVNSNDGVTLSAVSGSVAVSTSNGPIIAQLESVDPGSTVSLVTSNGRIEVALPPEFEGRVLAETDTGPIDSEFAVTPAPPPGLARPGRVLSGRIGSGEGLLRLRTNNAGILIRRSGD